MSDQKGVIEGVTDPEAKPSTVEGFATALGVSGAAWAVAIATPDEAVGPLGVIDEGVATWVTATAFGLASIDAVDKSINGG